MITTLNYRSIKKKKKMMMMILRRVNNEGRWILVMSMDKKLSHSFYLIEILPNSVEREIESALLFVGSWYPLCPTIYGQTADTLDYTRRRLTY